VVSVALPQPRRLGRKSNGMVNGWMRRRVSGHPLVETAGSSPIEVGPVAKSLKRGAEFLAARRAGNTPLLPREDGVVCGMARAAAGGKLSIAGRRVPRDTKVLNLENLRLTQVPDFV
jgi:hypothetical protein